MCEIYVKADPRLYQKRRRSLRVGGVVTTLSLENQFWDTLEEMAAGEAISMPQLVGKLYRSDGLPWRSEQLCLVLARVLHALHHASIAATASTKRAPSQLTGAPSLKD